MTKKAAIPRLTTGVRNLNEILKEGWPQGTVTIIAGPPGAGKTILAQQICCARIVLPAPGGPAMIVTVPCGHPSLRISLRFRTPVVRRGIAAFFVMIFLPRAYCHVPDHQASPSTVRHEVP